jgi:hypothetical protein
MKLRCPNDPAEGTTIYVQHSTFSRRHEMVVEKTYLENGVQWALDKPTVLEDKPIDVYRCQTCGATAIEEEA